MSLKVHLTPGSSNSKTGPIPVSTTSADSCPPECPLKKAGCYANSGPLALHWRQVTEGHRGASWGEFCEKVAALPEGQLWRHNQCGDLPHRDGVIDRVLVQQLVEANRGRLGYTYTHHRMSKWNSEVVLEANQADFVINLSANNLNHADRLAELNVGPVVALVLDDPTEDLETPGGRDVLFCAAQFDDEVSCETCGACANPVRDYVIGFIPHGCQRLSAEQVAAIDC